MLRVVAYTVLSDPPFEEPAQLEEPAIADEAGSPVERRPGLTRAFSSAMFVLLLASLVLRCSRLDLMEFKNDELYFFELGRANAADVGSVRSTNAAAELPHPPGIVDFLTLSMIWTDDPAKVVWTFVAANLVALGLYFAFLRSLFGARVALWGTALFSSMPWAVIFSRKISSADIIFPFAIAFYAALFSTLRRYRPWKVWLTFLCLALFLQTHMTTWFVVPALLAFAVLCRIRAKPRDVLIGVGIVFVVFLPYLLDVMQLDRGQVAVKARQPAELGLVADNVRQCVNITTGLAFERLLGEQGLTRLAGDYAMGWTTWVFRGWAVLALGALAFYLFIGARYPIQLRRTRSRSPEGELATLFGLVFLSVMAAFLAMERKAVWHHVLVVYPAIPLFVTMLLARLERAGRPRLHRALQVAVLVAVTANVWFVHGFVDALRKDPNVFRSGSYGMPYAVRTQWSEKRWNAWRDSVTAGAEQRSQERRGK